MLVRGVMPNVGSVHIAQKGDRSCGEGQWLAQSCAGMKTGRLRA